MKKLVVWLFSFSVPLFWAGLALAEETAAPGTAKSGIGLGLALASGLGIGIAAFGGALGQGKASAAALEGIARNPEASGKILTPMIIALALIESLVIYALVIAFLLQGKI
jgi:F-type H+-transporting ATPase subunit c